MAGSLAWYKYTDDRGQVWGVQMDEDKAGVEGAGFTPVLEADNLNTLPSGMEMRGVNAVRTSGAGAGFVSEFQPCATQAATLYAGTTKTFTRNSQNYSVSSTRGETRRVPKALNTGLVGKSPTVATGGAGGGT